MNKKVTRQELKKLVEKSIIRDEENKRISWSATSSIKEVLMVLNSSLSGLDEMQIRRNRMIYGRNQINDRRRRSIRKLILNSLHHPTCSVVRKQENEISIPQKDLVVGDIVHITEGDVAPADLRVIMADGLMVNQGFITGDGHPVKKNAGISLCELEKAADYNNNVIMGTNVTAGAGEAVVLSVGSHTILGTMNEILPDGKKKARI